MEGAAVHSAITKLIARARMGLSDKYLFIQTTTSGGMIPEICRFGQLGHMLRKRTILAYLVNPF